MDNSMANYQLISALFGARKEVKRIELQHETLMYEARYNAYLSIPLIGLNIL